MGTKKEFSALDAQPIILYAKTDQSVDIAVPVVCNTTGNLLIASAGDVASGSTDSGNPVKTGGIAKQSNPAAVSDGQRVGSLYDDVGRQVVTLSIRDLKVMQKTTLTTTASTIVLASASALFLDIYGFICTNTSAVATVVRLRDNTTEKAAIAVPAGETRGFMLPESGGLPQAAVTVNWTALLDTAATSVEITVLAVKNV